MINKYLCLSILIIFIFVSCVHNKNTLDKLINEQLSLNYSSIIEEYDTIYIIPRRGCNSCIVYSDIIFEEKKYSKKNLFIFTRLISEKYLRIELGEENLLLENVIIDKYNLFDFPEFKDSQYPLELIKDIDNCFYYDLLE